MTTTHAATQRTLMRDSRILIGRSVRHIIRSTDALLLSIALPVMVLLLFVYVFGGAIRTDTKYVNYVAPGIILLTAGFGAGLTATSVCADLTDGFMDRLRSMPVQPSSAVAGHVVASMVRNLIVTALVFVVALGIGFRPGAGTWQWVGIVSILSLYVFTITWIAVILGMVARSVDAASGFAFFISFVPYVSSAFVPTDTMPAPLRAIADYQPVTPITATARGLLLDQPIGNNAWLAIAWCAGILLVAIPLSAGSSATERPGDAPGRPPLIRPGHRQHARLHESRDRTHLNPRTSLRPGRETPRPAW